MNIARSTLKLTGAQVVAMVVSFLGVAYFANVLGADALGTFFLFQTVFTMLVEFGGVGLNVATTKRLSEGRDGGTVIATAATLKGVLVLIVVAGIVVFQQPINAYLGSDLAVYLTVMVVIQQFVSLTNAILRGQLRPGATALPKLAFTVLFVGIGVALIREGYGLRGPIIGLILGSAVQLALGLSRSSLTLARPSRRTAKSLFDFSKYGYVSQFSRYMFNWTDVLLIGLLLTTVDVGIYELPWRVMAFVTVLGASLAKTMFPKMSNWNSSEDQSRIENLLAGAIPTALLLVVPALFGASVLAREILTLGFGAEYADGWLVLIVVAGVRLVEATDTMLSQTLQALDRPELDARAEMLAIIANLALNLLSILEYGILGAAVATLCATVLKLSLHARSLSTLLSLTLRYRALGGIVAASLAMAVVLVGARTVVALETLLQLIGFIGFGAVLYGLGIMLVPPTRRLVVDHARRAGVPV